MFTIFGRPWDVYLAQNQLANRAVMDAVGTTGKITVARNNSERIEKCISLSGHWLASIILPTILDLFVLRLMGQRLRTAPLGNPAKLPFEVVERNAAADITANPTEATLKKYGLTLKELQTEYGLKHIKDFTPKLAAQVRRLKLLIMVIDFAFIALKGQFLYLFRNWFTEKNSGKKGFVGEFNYTNEAFRKAKQDQFNKEKSKRRKISEFSAIASSIAAPLLVTIALTSRSTRAGLGFLKRQLPKINYTDGIFIGRLLIFYQTLFTYEVPKLMAARDSHEFREDLIELGMFNFLYFGGDTLIAAVMARRMQKKTGLTLLKGVALTKTAKLFGKSMQVAIPYHEMFRKLKDNTHPAYKASRKIFFTSLFTSAVALALFNVANYSITRYKATKQQKSFNRNLITPLLNVISQSSRQRPILAGAAS